MTYLGFRKCTHLYTPGMTFEEAEQAVKRDPGYIQGTVMTYLGFRNCTHLYTPGMTMEQAEEAVRRSNLSADPIVVVV